MERCCAIVAKAIADLDGDIADTVRTCIYLTDRSDFPAVAAVHGRWFGTARPATTTLIVSGFIRPEWRVEIEAEVLSA
jgi:enamine deaminase RidA (YjgF/YER057c/UK114 family)